MMMQKGLLIINLGTPQSAELGAVRRYLNEFFKDKRVIQINAFLRYALLYGYILPFRAPKSLHGYQTIWTDEGSPLLVNSRNLLKKLQFSLKNEYKVALGMRYGTPSIEEALQSLEHCDEITILPLYPQYSSAATGSSIEKALHLLANKPVLPSLHIIREFYQNTAFIKAQASLIKPFVEQHDFILFSYHGLPEYHLQATGCVKPCLNPCAQSNHRCYRAQCFQTSYLLAEALGLTKFQYTTSFQSRLGKTPWIKPYTEEIFRELIQKGVKRLAVACPSFVADCLETLEEIGIRAQKQWQDLGGQHFSLVPSLNYSHEWVEAITSMVRQTTDNLQQSKQNI